MKTQARKSETLRFHKRQLLRALEHLRSHLDQPVVLSEIAALAGLSQFHFHRVFRGMMGEALVAHVRRLRLERAALGLRDSRRQVLELALEAGFDSHESFTRAFRAAFGVSPSGFRRRRGASPLLNAPSGVHYAPPGVPVADFRTSHTSKTPMNVEIETLAPMRVAYLHHTGPYAECGTAWDALCTALGSQGYLAGPVRFLGLSYDDPTDVAPDKLRYDACIVVDESYKPVAPVQVKLIAGGDFARVLHRGPHEKLSETYAALLGRWIPRSGRRLRDEPAIEEYLNAPENTAPEDLLTLIHAPLLAEETCR